MNEYFSVILDTITLVARFLVTSIVFMLYPVFAVAALLFFVVKFLIEEIGDAISDIKGWRK